MRTTTTHLYPAPADPYVPCCGTDYHELPIGDRLTSDVAKVTCGKESS